MLASANPDPEPVIGLQTGIARIGVAADQGKAQHLRLDPAWERTQAGSEVMVGGFCSPGSSESPGEPHRARNEQGGPPSELSEPISPWPGPLCDLMSRPTLRLNLINRNEQLE